MVIAQRQNRIKQLIFSQGSANAFELAKMFNVSYETIRRDLVQLEKEGYVKKNHGGAVVIEDMQKLTVEISPVQQRKSMNSAEKARIAIAAANIIREDTCVYIDAGSTTCSMLQFINCKRLNVVTNSVDIANECAFKADWNVVVVGGQLIKKSMCMVGLEAEDHINRLNIDIAFLGSSGVSYIRGFTSSNVHESNLKKAAIAKALRAIVLADNTKIGHTQLYTFAVFDDVGCFITTEGAIDDSFRQKADEAGMELIEV